MRLKFHARSNIFWGASSIDPVTLLVVIHLLGYCAQLHHLVGSCLKTMLLFRVIFCGSYWIRLTGRNDWLVGTVCRALGIPARPVSNLVSAHDANGTFTIDRYFDSLNNEVGDPFNPHGSDSIWNFHVWVEAWMSRPDLPKGSTPLPYRVLVVFDGIIHFCRIRRMASYRRYSAGIVQW